MGLKVKTIKSNLKVILKISMKLFCLIFSVGINALALDKKEASKFLRRRARNAAFESVDDLELECIEKRCTAEELDEVYDFETGFFKEPSRNHGHAYDKAFDCWRSSNLLSDLNCQRKLALRQCLTGQSIHRQMQQGVMEQQSSDETVNTSASSKRTTPTRTPQTTYTATEYDYDSYATRGDN